jgi:hypothetical protein
MAKANDELEKWAHDCQDNGYVMAGECPVTSETILSLLSENRAMRELLHEIRFVHGDALESGIREEVDALLNPESK